MKAKLMAVLLAVGLGVTGLAATAQAAENDTRAVNGCEHEYEKLKPIFQGTSDYNEKYHIIYYSVDYLCTKCGHVDTKDEIEYEIHDYENVYDNYGYMIYSYCIVCGAHSN